MSTAIRRKWKWLAAALVTLIVLAGAGFVSLILFVIFSSFKSTDAYQIALVRAQKSPDVVSAIGNPIEAGFFVSGNVATSGGSGTADMEIPISGPKGNATIYLNAEKKAGQWIYSDLVVEIEQSKQRVNLLQSKNKQDGYE